MDDTDTATVYSMNVSRVSISILTLHDIMQKGDEDSYVTYLLTLKQHNKKCQARHWIVFIFSISP